MFKFAADSPPFVYEESPSGLQSCNEISGKTMLGRRHPLLKRLPAADCFALRPEIFAGRLEDPMDAFSEILSGVKLRGALFFSAEFSTPWGFTAPSSKVIAN